jgi:hypothetical protein
LYLFKVRNRDTAGIGQEVRENKHFVLVENIICFRCRGPVGKLAEDFTFYLTGVPLGDIGSVLGNP